MGTILCSICTKKVQVPDIDDAGHAIFAGGEWRTFSAQQWMMFQALKADFGRPVSRQILYEAASHSFVDEMDPPIDEIVNVQVHHIRTKLEGSRYAVRNLRGVGWVLEMRKDDLVDA